MFHEYKEPKLQTDPLSLRALLIPLPNRLLLGLLQLTELLIFYRVTILSKQMQLQMPCLVGFQERFLWFCAFESHVSEPRSHVSKPRSHVSKPCSHVFKFCTFKPHISKPRFNVISKLYSFKSYPIGSLHFFNSDPVLSDLWLRNICPVLATSIVRRILKQAGWRTYKNNDSGMGLRL